MQRCLHDTMKAFRTAFLTQMPSNSLNPPEMERLDADISDLRDFYARCALHSVIESTWLSVLSLDMFMMCSCA